MGARGSIVWFAIALSCLAGCDFEGRFDAAARQPVGRDPARPLAGAWEGECAGAGGKHWRVKLILGSDTSCVCDGAVGPKDYAADMVALDSFDSVEDSWVLRWVEEREGTTFLQSAEAPEPNPYSTSDEGEEYPLDACATGDLLTMAYRVGAKETVCLATLRRVTRTAPSH